jgi:hypothetical protein
MRPTPKFLAEVLVVSYIGSSRVQHTSQAFICFSSQNLQPYHTM